MPNFSPRVRLVLLPLAAKISFFPASASAVSDSAHQRIALRVFSVLLIFGALSMPSVMHAQTCPNLLEGARRLVLVTFAGMSSSTATLRLLERPGAGHAWRLYDSPEPVVLGVNGAGWGHGFRHLGGAGDPLKREGDLRTPAGIFAIGRPFGFAPSPLSHYLQLEADTVCVDDPKSAAYNTITSRRNVGERVTVESMRSGTLYRRGLVVRYPTNAATRAGSCIFIHVWKGPGSGTAGCIALPEARVAALQEFAIGPDAVLAVLPDEALGGLANCLPSVTRKPY